MLRPEGPTLARFPLLIYARLIGGSFARFRRSILRLVAGRAVGLALVGVVAGTVGALLLGRTLRALLFDVAPTDPAVLAAGAAAVAAVSLLASLLPARRATRVDPLIALREE